MASISTTKILSIQGDSSSPTTAPTATSDSTSFPTTSISSLLASASSIMATPSSSSSPLPSPGLSTGAKAGIAAACAIGLVFLVSLGVCLHISYRRKRDPAYKREKETALNAYNSTYPHQAGYPNIKGEGGAPLLRDGSYMDLATQTGEPSPMFDDGYLYPVNISRNTSSAGSSFLSPDNDIKLEKERWRESHSIAGYFDSKTHLVANTTTEAEPRLSTGDKMIAEWRKQEIETARAKSRDRSSEQNREPHPMAAYQTALPPFFPNGFRDVSGDVQRARESRIADHVLEPELHEMDVGDHYRRT